MLRFMIQNVGSPHQSRMRSWLPRCRNIVSIGFRHNTPARECARTIAGWKPLPLLPVKRLPKVPRLPRVR